MIGIGFDLGHGQCSWLALIVDWPRLNAGLDLQMQRIKVSVRKKNLEKKFFCGCWMIYVIFWVFFWSNGFMCTLEPFAKSNVLNVNDTNYLANTEDSLSIATLSCHLMSFKMDKSTWKYHTKIKPEKHNIFSVEVQCIICNLYPIIIMENIYFLKSFECRQQKGLKPNNGN